MKKKYIYPTIEILPYRTQIALCSGGGGAPGGIGGGKDAEEFGRGPRRTMPF